MEVDRICSGGCLRFAELIRGEVTLAIFLDQEPVNPVTVENLLLAASRLQINSIVEGFSAKKLMEQEGDSRKSSFFKVRDRSSEL